jgi:hypothetical protein
LVRPQARDRLIELASRDPALAALLKSQSVTAKRDASGRFAPPVDAEEHARVLTALRAREATESCRHSLRGVCLAVVTSGGEDPMSLRAPRPLSHQAELHGARGQVEQARRRVAAVVVARKLRSAADVVVVAEAGGPVFSSSPPA